jgi:hypothetical protein
MPGPWAPGAALAAPAVARVTIGANADHHDGCAVLTCKNVDPCGMLCVQHAW